MLKALLVSLAAFISFDAVAWDSAMRVTLLRQATNAVAEVEALDWTWA